MLYRSGTFRGNTTVYRGEGFRDVTSVCQPLSRSHAHSGNEVRETSLYRGMAAWMPAPLRAEKYI